MQSAVIDVVRCPHHEQLPLCSSRPAYRQGRKLTAVKVYTISDESKHILIVGVPSIDLQAEVRKLCLRYGDVLSVAFVPNYAEEKFTDVFHVQYARLQSSRFAKQQLDGKEFFGGILHVCYAPEIESVADTREKLIQRRKEVAIRCSRNARQDKPIVPFRQYERKPIEETTQFKKGRVLNAGLLQCVWNGKVQSEDPRKSFELSNTKKVYGPLLPGPEWKAAGVRERFLEPRKSTNTTVRLSKSNLQFAGASSSTSGPNTSSKLTDKTVLKFIPSQVKGVQRKTICQNAKVDEILSTGDKSLDSTVQAVRERIRNVSVPNIKIHLSGRKESVLSSKTNAL